ncbi:YugE family protein [Planococcus sp. CP5-4]|uniref:DUF1871 family protein n=1 Tax=unclassified Planococcus (in: firmicutes) TaxID=2662419 RepID=UPI001C214407|nr:MULTISPECIES: DUF1871 family protein [unclassified Planococcus (in: firmicutes)]MBU9673981.1 YugE family protein [Planococcus sp. CP5-4_YE]MBV0909851.1 YugE family protein [Planococcus sp. CP5-4_UN]MBW6064450.1 YugE family protein [Planococcus sp. CP5-4]
MDTVNMDKRALRIMEGWDPFSVGTGEYNTEAADVIDKLHDIDHPSDLAKAIQGIYESRFKQWIPLEKCVEVSYKLLAVKYEAKHII